jgi:wobble nucleotide-excising tRNase
MKNRKGRKQESWKAILSSCTFNHHHHHTRSSPSSLILTTLWQHCDNHDDKEKNKKPRQKQNKIANKNSLQMKTQKELGRRGCLSPPPNATAQTNIYSFGKNWPFFLQLQNRVQRNM